MLVFLAKPKAQASIIYTLNNVISGMRIMTHKINYIYRYYIPT